jgi:hypothetical protein
MHIYSNNYIYAYNLPIELKSFLTAMVDIIPDERSLSAISGQMLIFAHRPRNGNAEYRPFYDEIIYHRYVSDRARFIHYKVLSIFPNSHRSTYKLMAHLHVDYTETAN